MFHSQARHGNTGGEGTVAVTGRGTVFGGPDSGRVKWRSAEKEATTNEAKHKFRAKLKLRGKYPKRLTG